MDLSAGEARRRHLIVFARFPVMGGGKRRLARGIGLTGAVHFQRVRVRHLLAGLARDPRWTTWIAATPDHSGPWPSHVRVVYQGRGDLGARMARMARAMPPGDIVMIGSDIPGILAGDISNAFGALGSYDAVFGPAPDGGYWLIGLKGSPRRELPFDGVRWSSAHTLADTVRNLRGAKIKTLRTVQDIDEAPDLATEPGWQRLVMQRSG